MRLACVVHRFGADIAGGSETHCRAIASRLAERHDVTVLTTCATDHVSWRNALPPGRSRDGRLTVIRFPVARQRSLRTFADASEIAFSGSASAAEEEAWFRENGPETPALLEHLAAAGSSYDCILFWAFRYHHAYFGLPLVADRAVLVPTAEDDPVMRFRILGAFFERPAGFLFLTPEEEALIGRRRRTLTAPARIIGSGLDPVAGPATPSHLNALGVTTPFVLYLGRIDPNKGCEALIRHYLGYHARVPRPAPLVLAGPANMPIPQHPAIVPLGVVDADAREALLAAAAVLVVPSPYESLSLVLLEAWNHAVPALVNATCAVLDGQASRSNGALAYRTSDEFAAALEFLLMRRDVAARLGRQGRDYVDREYRWPRVMAQVEDVIRLVVARRTPAPGDPAA